MVRNHHVPEIRLLTKGIHVVRMQERKAAGMKPHNVSTLEGNQQTSLKGAPRTGNNGTTPANGVAASENEELNHRPVPPRSVIKASVRCRVLGQGRPLPYPLDEENGE
jgi:hypothetical protein